MSIRLGILSFFALACACSAQTVTVSQREKEPDFHLYSVIFGITIGADSKIEAFRVAKVFEPRSGTDHAVDIQVPQAFIDAAKKRIESQKYRPNLKDGKPVEFQHFFLYTPSEPATLITDVEQPLDKQP